MPLLLPDNNHFFLKIFSFKSHFSYLFIFSDNISCVQLIFYYLRLLIVFNFKMEVYFLSYAVFNLR